MFEECTLKIEVKNIIKKESRVDRHYLVAEMVVMSYAEAHLLKQRILSDTFKRRKATCSDYLVIGMTMVVVVYTVLQ